MKAERTNLLTLIGAFSLGVVAFYSTFLPPFPVLGWFAAALTTAPFERWWYSLPEADRSLKVYAVGTTIASAVYPALVTLAFWLWCRPRRPAVSPYPLRTAILALVAVVLSAAYFAVGWRYGVRYQGLDRLATYLVLSALTLTILTAGWLRYRIAGAWWPSLVLTWGLFAWICVGAFPWLGEMP